MEHLTTRTGGESETRAGKLIPSFVIDTAGAPASATAAGDSAATALTPENRLLTASKRTRGGAAGSRHDAEVRGAAWRRSGPWRMSASMLVMPDTLEHFHEKARPREGSRPAHIFCPPEHGGEHTASLAPLAGRGPHGKKENPSSAR